MHNNSKKQNYKILVDVDNTLIIDWPASQLGMMKEERYNDNLINALIKTGNNSIVLFTSMHINSPMILNEKIQLIKYLKDKGITVERIIISNELVYSKEFKENKQTLFRHLITTKNSLAESKEKEDELYYENIDMIEKTYENIDNVSNQDKAKSKLPMLDRVAKIYPNQKFLLIDDQEDIIKGCTQHAKDKNIQFESILNKSDNKCDEFSLTEQRYIDMLLEKNFVNVNNLNNFINVINLNNFIKTNWVDNLNSNKKLVIHSFILCALCIIIGAFLTFYNLPMFALFSANKILTHTGCIGLGILLGRISYKINYNNILDSKTEYLNKFITKKTNSKNIYFFIIAATLICTFTCLYFSLNAITTILLSTITFLLAANMLYDFHKIDRIKNTRKNKSTLLTSCIIIAILHFTNIIPLSSIEIYLLTISKLLLLGYIFIGILILKSTFEKLYDIYDETNKDSNITIALKVILFSVTVSIMTWAMLTYFPQFTLIETIEILLLPVLILFNKLLSDTSQKEIISTNPSISKPDDKIEPLTTFLEPMFKNVEGLNKLSDMPDHKEASQKIFQSSKPLS